MISSNLIAIVLLTKKLFMKYIKGVRSLRSMQHKIQYTGGRREYHSGAY